MMNRMMKRAAVAAGIVGVVAVAWLLLGSGEGEDGWLRASGTVEATEAQLGFQAPGRISEIAVREGDRVEPGAELAWLDQEELRARRDQAAANLASAEAVLAELEEGARPEEVAQARAAQEAAAEKSADADRDLGRAGRLHEAGAISDQDLDKARLAAEVARSQNKQAAEQLQLVRSGPRRERIDAQRGQVHQARAALRAADAALANAVVRAPFGGLVTVRHREAGAVVPPGSPVLTVMDPEDRWVRIYVAEDRIGAVKLGAPVSIKADTYPDRTYSGEVMHIASEAEFTPKNVQTQEERVKLVYAVKVRVTGDPSLDLKPGMPADVRVEAPPVDSESLLGATGAVGAER
jgi:HlyD family secretion protein